MSKFLLADFVSKTGLVRVGDGDELLEEDVDDEDKLSSEDLLFTEPLLLMLVFRGEVVREVHGFLAGGMATILKQSFFTFI